MLAACGGTSASQAAPGAGATPAFASAQASPDSASLGATVTFRETGLKAGAAVNVVVTADGFADYGCADASGRLVGPSLPVTAQVSALRQFHADATGQVLGTLQLPPPAAAGIECRPEHHRRVTSARYTNLEVADVTNRVRAGVDGEVAAP